MWVARHRLTGLGPPAVPHRGRPAASSGKEEAGVERAQVEAWARELMGKHELLPQWSFAWDRARTRAGHCRFADHTISVSAPLMELYPEDLVRETLLHEIAHALVGPGHNHDAAWRATAVAIGASGRVRLPQETPAPPAKWHGVCPNGHEFWRHRRPAANGSCSRCSPTYDARYRIAWGRLA